MRKAICSTAAKQKTKDGWAEKAVGGCDWGLLVCSPPPTNVTQNDPKPSNALFWELNPGPLAP
eukprot:358244-Amphidinium_carterae.1